MPKPMPVPVFEVSMTTWDEGEGTRPSAVTVRGGGPADDDMHIAMCVAAHFGETPMVLDRMAQIVSYLALFDPINAMDLTAEQTAFVQAAEALLKAQEITQVEDLG